jgi:chromate reductase
MRILGLCGSLRAASKNRAALMAAAANAAGGCELVIWRGLAELPPFSPDLDKYGIALPTVVEEFHAETGAADGLLIACPEYAHGIPGTFKNALDWLVGSTAFPGKPVALVNVAPHATHAQAQLREVLTTMSALIVEEACLTIDLSGPPDQPLGSDAQAAISSALSAFVTAISAKLHQAGPKAS